MTFVQRLLYYFGGVGIGLLFLIFFLSGKRTSCNYGLNARVVKALGGKKIDSAYVVGAKLKAFDMDTLVFRTLLSRADVDFGQSAIRDKEDCKEYQMISEYQGVQYKLRLANCEKGLVPLHIQKQQ